MYGQYLDMDRLLSGIDKPSISYCPHLNKDSEVYIYFTGNYRDHILTCNICKDLDISSVKKSSESKSFIEYIESGYPNPWQLDGITGEPTIRINTEDTKFFLEEIGIEPKDYLEPIAIKEILGHPNQLLILYVHRLKLRLDVESDLEISIYDINEKKIIYNWKNIGAKNLNLSQPLVTEVSNDGSMVAIANVYGYTGYVLDLETQEFIFSFTRGKYYTDNCVFPITFFEYNSETLLAHTTDWNQLDIVNPRTGKYITDVNRKLDHKNENYLDYFFSELSVSPNNKKFLTNGWVWQPAGIIAFLDIETCMNKQFGTEKVVYSQLDDNWGWETVWLSDTKVGIERFGGWDWSIPGFTIVDVESGNLVDWFPGPIGKLFVDREDFFLLSVKDSKIAMWNLINGELLSSYSLGFSPDLTIYMSSIKVLVFVSGSSIYTLKIQKEE